MEFQDAPKKLIKFCQQEGMSQDQFFHFVKHDKMWQAQVMRSRGFGKRTLLQTFSWLCRNEVVFNNDRPAYPDLTYSAD